MDFVLSFGFLGCILEFYFDPIINRISFFSYRLLGAFFTHGISGFVSLYLGFSCLAKMTNKNAWVPLLVLLFFVVIAEIVNLSCGAYFKANDIWLHVNYMFLVSGDVMPLDLIMKNCKGNQALYAISVAIGMGLFMIAFDTVFMGIRSFIHQHRVPRKLREHA